MTDQELERRLRDWYRSEIPEDEQVPPALRSGLAMIPRVSPLPRRRFASRRGVTLLAAAALVGVLAWGAAIGARLLTPSPVPSVVPAQLPSTLPAELPSSQPSIVPAMGRIVYTRWKQLSRGEEDCTSRFFCYHASVVVSNDDGSDERELFADALVVTASRDGSKVIISKAEDDHTYLTDVDGSAPRLFDTHCQTPCQDDWGFSFSADGSRVAFTRVRSGQPGPTGSDLVVAVMDMTTGAVVELESTHDEWARPTLSPDGARVVFGNHVVDADGNNLRQIIPADLFTDEQGFNTGIAFPQWSPDGSLIAFTSFNDTFPTNPPERNSQERMDIYVVRPDGTGLQRLTTDSVGPLGTNDPGLFGAAFPTWTRDGRIVFSRFTALNEDPLELWVMDADGSNATRLDPSNAAALTALGCVTCPYRPSGPVASVSPNFGYWIPAR